MALTKLGGYTVILSALALFVGQVLEDAIGQTGSSIAQIWASLGFACATVVFCTYFRKEDEDNGILYLIPILALVGWTASVVGEGMRIRLDQINIESVNAVASISGAASFSAAGGGFLANALLGYYIFGKPQFSQNVIYRIVTVVFIIGSLAFVAMGIVMPFFAEGREAATAVGEYGSQTFPFDMSVLILVWMPGMLATLIWSIWTGVIFVKK